MLFEIGLAIQGIKAANEAIAAIKEMCGNVQSVGEMGKDLTKLADAKEELQKSAADGDMEAFWTLQDIAKREKEIKEMFIYQGRAGLWDDYCNFIKNRQEMRRKAKEREEAKRLAKRKAIKTGLMYVGVGIAVLGTVGGAVAFLLFLLSMGGK